MQKINLIFFSLIVIFLSKVYAEEKNLVFDIYPFNWDKTYQVSRELKGCTLWFVGDQCGPGGNDRTLYNHLNPSKRSFSTSGPRETIRILKNKILPKISV